MGAGCGNTVLAGLRGLVVVVALAVVGLGAWILHTIHDVQIRGDAVLDTVQMDQADEDMWRTFIEAVATTESRMWIAIGAGSFTSLSAIFVLLSLKVGRLNISRHLLVFLELSTMLTMAGAFAASVTFAIKLGTPCIGLNPSSSSILSNFEMLCPLSKSYAIAGGIGWFILLTTSLTALITTYHHSRSKKSCSFEPTASALGMGDGYQAVTPQTQRATVPTLYDPRKPIPGSPERLPREDERKFAGQGAKMGRRDSWLSDASGDSDKGISGPLGLEKPVDVRQMRPARPWSEMRRGR